LDLAALTLLHLLVFVYWLGGDLGAFYASSILSDPDAAPAARLAAAKVVANVDMAPRTALILAFPTGASLAAAKGWWVLSPTAQAAIWIGFVLWLALAWRLHLRHAPPGSALRALDLAIRWLALAAFAAAGVAALAGRLEVPLFLGLKLLILAAAIGAGLAVRGALKRFGPAVGRLAAGDAGPETHAAIAGGLARVRPAVLLIWLLLVAATFLGLWTPQ
jgi:hypothetical protein